MAVSPDWPALRDWLQKLPTNLSGTAIVANTPLLESGLLDSLGILDLVSFLEERFALALPLKEFVPENFRTPAAILAMTERLRAAPGSGD